MKGFFQLIKTAFEDKTAYFSSGQLPAATLECRMDGSVAELTNLPFDELLIESFRSWYNQLTNTTLHKQGVMLLANGSGRLIALFAGGKPVIAIDGPFAGELADAQIAAAMETGTEPSVRLHVPLTYDGYGQIGAIGFLPAEEECTDAWFRAMTFSFVPHLTLAAEKRRSESLASESLRLDGEFKKRDLLYQAAEKLHSLIDVDSVLAEVIKKLKELYPAVEIDLLLSQDNHSTSIPVKPLNFSRVEDDICTRAFMEGRELLLTDSRSGIKEAALPLVGNQGVYGIIHIVVPVGALIHSDIQIMSTLARTAGTAFENAKLYEQSNLLVSELRLINEITKRLNQSLQLNEIFNFASTELIKIFDADFCCILELDRKRSELIVQATNLPAMFNENFELDYGFAGVVSATKEPLIISDYFTNPRIGSKLMQTTQSRSLIASPIIVNGDVVGVVLVTHRLANFFSYENYKLLQVLSSHIGLAIANASLHNEVQRMVITDNLTGLYERHYLDEQVNVHQKKDFCGSLIVVDIDNFKTVNDTYGHQVGDKILIQVSNIIKACIRDSDIAARWGGEELAVYLPQVSREQAVRIAERIRSRVVEETEPRVTVSCGISDWHWQDEKISVESLFYRSDMALYKAKNEGKNQIKIG